MEKKFNIGDLVELRSGSSIMTVDGYNANGLVMCIWFASEAKRSEVFREPTLRLVQATEAPEE